ncbi:hypothetical protein I4U23_018927 [Adineta vaga]|nr:hypothetical protein I4U23_018927 [Adineta vaga]
MASPMNLEERFDRAVKTIQNLPADGIIQPSNLTKLIFYGLYKQAMLGPCKESRPSILNYIGRAKWEAWDRCRSMTKEQAMLAYIDEIRKIIETMPETNELLEFAQSMGFSSRSVEDELIISNLSSTTTSASSLSSSSSPLVSDIDDYYDDATDLVVPSHNQLISDDSNSEQTVKPITLPNQSSHSRRTNNRSNLLVYSQHSANIVRHSTSLVPLNDPSKETQRAILTALTKLQRDIHNILERLNRLETLTYLLQQKELMATSQTDSSSWWMPLSNFRRGTTAFILLWPFLAFFLIRLFQRAKIIIRFRRQHL